MSTLRVIYCGTPEFAVPALDALAASPEVAGHEIEVVAVYTQPDRPAGRGKKLTASPVKNRALELGFPVEQPQSLKEPQAQNTLAAYRPDLLVVAAYGLLLPAFVLDLPRLGAINIHASLLPRWRGAAPINRAIAAGDRQTGITIMQMALGLDTGAMWHKAPVDIDASETAKTLHDKLASLGASALIEALPAIVSQSGQPEPQDESQACYAHKLKKSEAQIDWTESAAQIERNIRAFNPWPVAQTTLDGKPVRIWQARAFADSPTSAEPGTVLEVGPDGVLVATAAGVLSLQTVQRAGKKPMPATDFAHGAGWRRYPQGVCFE